MDIHERYAYEIQHEISFLKVKTGKANYAILSQLSIVSEIPDDDQRVHESCHEKTIGTTIEYEDEQY